MSLGTARWLLGHGPKVIAGSVYWSGTAGYYAFTGLPVFSRGATLARNPPGRSHTGEARNCPTGSMISCCPGADRAGIERIVWLMFDDLRSRLAERWMTPDVSEEALRVRDGDPVITDHNPAPESRTAA